MLKYSLFFVTALLTACGGSTPVPLEEDEQLGSLPSVIITPENNPSNQAKTELGRLLFWDPILSGNEDVACATCHHPEHAYAENIDISQGVNGHGLSASRTGGELVKRNAPTILNTAFNGIDELGLYDPLNTAMFWDNRSQSLEAQAIEPILSAEEMRGQHFTEDTILIEIITRLTNIEEYRERFNQAFGDNTITEEKIGQAIAAFERTLITNNSRFDQYAKGDATALSRQEIQGLNAFIEAGCNNCHSGPMLSDFELHQLPIDENTKLVQAGIEDDGVEGAFRTPSLRNVALTAPYMHNGTVATLREAILFYDDMSNPSNDPDISALDFDDPNDATIDSIEAFLKALSDEDFDKTIPTLVPSGLPPGGNI